jgi:hypothetical protein
MVDDEHESDLFPGKKPSIWAIAIADHAAALAAIFDRSRDYPAVESGKKITRNRP